MPSWQSYVINPILRWRIKRPLSRSLSPLQARHALGGSPMPPPPGATFTPATLGGIPGEWVQAQAATGATLLYLHGGGYFACSPKSHRPITAAYALRGLRVFVPDYRLAPEHVFPAALEDALAVYRAMAAPFVIAGDSAGGGLAMATLLAAKAEGLAMPAGAILFSPWTDLAGTGASVQTNAKRDSMLVGSLLTQGADIYLAGADPKNPLASPLYGEFTGLPPLFIQASDSEILLDDSTRLATRARAAGVQAEITIWKNLPHVWQLAQTFLPEARLALDAAAAFAKSQLANTRVPA